MRPDERLGLARLAYLRAVTCARVSSTPATWGRVLAAAKNVKASMRELERGRCGSQARPPVPPGLAASAVRAPSRCVYRPARWPQLAQEWERARALAERARVLVRESCALRSSITEACQQSRAILSSIAGLTARLAVIASSPCIA
jgi:hypothetical protein